MLGADIKKETSQVKGSTKFIDGFSSEGFFQTILFCNMQLDPSQSAVNAHLFIPKTTSAIHLGSYGAHPHRFSAVAKKSPDFADLCVS